MVNPHALGLPLNDHGKMSWLFKIQSNDGTVFSEQYHGSYRGEGAAKKNPNKSIYNANMRKGLVIGCVKFYGLRKYYACSTEFFYYTLPKVEILWNFYLYYKNCSFK